MLWFIRLAIEWPGINGKKSHSVCLLGDVFVSGSNYLDDGDLVIP